MNLIDNQSFNIMTTKENSKTNKQAKDKSNGKGPKYYLDIENELIPWDEDTITTEEIIELGEWDPSKGVILINKKTNEERTLDPSEEIEIKPGMGFSKKVSFKRG
jgi:hypothetical protein